MATKNIEKKVDALSAEMARMRSLAISMVGRDNEGEYRPEFVEKILQTANEKSSGALFTTAEDFLARIR